MNYGVALRLVCNLPKDEIDRLAETTSSEMLQPAADIIDLTKRLGGRIHYRNMFEEDAHTNTIFVHGVNDFDIVLPDHSTPRRDRFTIAHELGHFFLHSWMGQRPLRAARSGSDRAEWEANWFAAGLLMPKQKFIDTHKKRPSISWLANEFDVSEHAASVRCTVLGLTH